jgi:enoyl-CoA hydratase
MLQGRNGIFSGGFDLGVFKTGSKADKLAMLKAGAEITERLLSYPMPTIAVCTGHAMAMGVFLLLSCDYRIGAEGGFKFAANEVAIGLTLPKFAIAVSRQRLTPAAFNRGLTLAYVFDTVAALQAGFLDELVPADKLEARCQELAAQINKLDMDSHRATKLRLREELLTTLRQAIEADCKNWAAQY